MIIKPTQVVLISICVLLVLLMSGKQYKEYFISNEFNIIFMSKYQTYDYINADADKFIAKSPRPRPNLYGDNDKSSYKSAAAKTAVGFNDYEKKQMTIMAMAVDQFLVENYAAIRPAEVPWKFALTEGTTYEDGKPHVRGDVIFLSTETLKNEIMDQCQFGFTLLYMRQNILFGRQVRTGATPWNATEIDWKFAERLPTCEFYKRIQYNTDIYNSIYDNEYMLSLGGAGDGNGGAGEPSSGPGGNSWGNDPNLKLNATRNSKNLVMDEQQYESDFPAR